MPDDDTLLSLRAAADQLGVHYMTAYRYVRLGTLPAKKVTGVWQVRMGDLRAIAGREQPRPGPGGIRWGPYRTQLHDRLTSGDEPGAWSVIERARVSGASPEDIHLQLIAPVLRVIGDAWSAGELNIAAEHRATGVAQRLIGRLGPSFARRGRKRGTVVIGGAPGDHHSIPLAILGDILRGRGLFVVDLGANTPPESFLQSAQDHDDVVAVAIGVGCDESIDPARQAAGLLHEQIPGIHVFVGGPAVTSERAARAIGADEYGATAVDVAHRCNELACE
ncbi:MAG: cobalamin-dependent protein [Acidimicrobiia bacterium]